jgi:AraC-like DNA-binding protein
MFLFDQAGAGEHLSTVSLPGRELAPFVELFWLQQAPWPRRLKHPWRIVLDPSSHIIFSISENHRSARLAQCNLVGARSTFVDRPANIRRLMTFGVRLHPGVLHLLTRHSAAEFTDRAVSVWDVFGTRGKLLMEQLAECTRPFQLIQSISGFLSRELAGVKNVDHVAMFRSNGDRASGFAAHLCLPSRTLYARVVQQVGLSPKRLLRIRRLYRALSACRSSRRCWAHIAAESGYADQAHMIRDFRDLLGATPGAWMQRAGSADLFNPNAESMR